MDRETFLDNLRRNNGYCECPELQPLYDIRKKAEKLERECDSLGEGLDLDNPRKGDIFRLTAYRNATEKFIAEVNHYHNNLHTFLIQGKVKKVLHESEDKENSTRTFNCAFCNQQIDFMWYDD